MDGLIEVEREAEPLRSGCYVVRPKGALGTCGFYPCPWTAQFVKASSAGHALYKTRKIFMTPKD